MNRRLAMCALLSMLASCGGKIELGVDLPAIIVQTTTGGADASMATTTSGAGGTRGTTSDTSTSGAGSTGGTASDTTTSGAGSTGGTTASGGTAGGGRPTSDASGLYCPLQDCEDLPRPDHHCTGRPPGNWFCVRPLGSTVACFWRLACCGGSPDQCEWLGTGIPEDPVRDAAIPEDTAQHDAAIPEDTAQDTGVPEDTARDDAAAPGD